MTTETTPTATANPAATATPPAFVHLRTHSEYSVVDGITRIPDMVQKAVQYQQPALALTDLANLFGLIKFYKATRKAGIKPIVGTDIWVENPSDRDKPHRALLLAENYDGYLSICRLLSQAWLDNQYRGRGEVKKEWLLAESNLIVLSGGRQGDVGQALLAGNTKVAQDLARGWAESFPQSFFIELQRAGHEDAETYVQAAIALAAELGLPVVATHPIQLSDRT